MMSLVIRDGFAHVTSSNLSMGHLVAEEWQCSGKTEGEEEVKNKLCQQEGKQHQPHFP